jgi:hypothetical protein
VPSPKQISRVAAPPASPAKQFALGVGTAALPFTGGFGQTASVIGPAVITTPPSLFINTNNQVSAGSSLSGGQFAP